MGSAFTPPKHRGRWPGDVWPYGFPVEQCSTCLGVGLRPGSAERVNSYRHRDVSKRVPPDTCPTCEGRGRLIVRGAGR